LDVRATRAAFAAGTLGTVGDHPSGEDVQRDVEVRDANRYDAHGMESHDSTKDTFGRGGASLRDSGEGVPTGSLRDAPGKAARTFSHVGSPWHTAMLRARPSSSRPSPSSPVRRGCEPADVKASWTELPFADDSYGAVFADPPWDSGHKMEVASFMREAMRIAPVAYLMSPWVYCAWWTRITKLWWREFPGVNTPILLARYERPAQLTLLDSLSERAV
jgi:hypothetical protein